MNISNEKIAYDQAVETKKKWDDIIENNTPYPCKKCWNNYFSSEFVVQYIDNPLVGKYRYLYECKQCKKDRIYSKRLDKRTSIEGAIDVIYTQIIHWAKQRSLEYIITKDNLMNIRNRQQGKCYYTGYPMQFEYIHYKEGKFNEKVKYQLSCDRLNNDLWYIPWNIVLCCTMANKMKWTLSEKEFYKVCKDISQKHL